MKNTIHWNNRSEYTEVVDPKTKMITQCSGTFVLHDISFRFSAFPGGVSGYALRGSVRIIDPNTGKLLKQRLKAEGNRDCSCSFHIKCGEKPVKADDIKAVVAKKAWHLYSVYIEDIRDACRAHTSSADITLLYLFTIFKKKWLDMCKHIKKGSKRSRDNADSLLSNYFQHFEERSVSDITGKDIEAARKHFGKRAARAETLGCDFWLFCSANHRIERNIANPFETAMPAVRKSKHNKSNKGKLTSLSAEQEARLHGIIRERCLSNPLYVGVCLIVDGGLTTTGIFELTWDRILFDKTDPNLVCLRITDNMNSYATHDFTRPVFPFAAEILRKYKDHLLASSDISEEQLAKRRIMAGVKNRVKHSPSDLARLCTKLMPAVTVTYQDIDTVSRQGAKSGAGVTILSNTYRYKLDTVCCLMQHDPDAYDYLQSNSLTGRTTADHYRSFSSWEGIRLLYTYLRRDTRFLPDSDKECSITEVCCQDGSVAKKVTGIPASCCVDVTLKNGESITVSSNARIRGTYKTTLVKQDTHDAHSD